MIRLLRNSAKAARVLCELLNKSVYPTRMDERSIPHAAMKDSIR